MGIEPGTSRFQIRQTLYRFSLYRTLLHTPPPILKFFHEFPIAMTSVGRLTHMPEKSPTAMGIEPGTSRFQIRQTLYRFSLYRTLLHTPPLIMKFFHEFHIAMTSVGRLTHMPEKSPTAMGIEPGTSRFQIRQTLYRVAIKASTYSKATNVSSAELKPMNNAKDGGV
ncbi:hypothetical protein DPMN_044419 [Dreissena polymorpha]|uniref:Uncharacterized protein n=1 Tax=Dreissena polymorpha TaxID=45954 RepID=A0A9D4D4G8_DREPO|nr:hypothetical protein DPMN_044419 [Dreissena polymorpha]